MCLRANSARFPGISRGDPVPHGQSLPHWLYAPVPVWLCGESHRRWQYRNGNGFYHAGDGVVLGLSLIGVGTGATMYSRTRIPASSAIRATVTALRLSVFQPVRIFKVTGTSAASTTASRSISPAAHHAVARAAAFLPFGGAAHIDVDDLGAALVFIRAASAIICGSPPALYRAGLDTGVVQARLRLATVPQPISGDFPTPLNLPLSGGTAGGMDDR